MQNIYDTRQKFKFIFLSLSLIIVAVFLYISNNLVKDLSVEERNKMEIWAEATRALVTERPDSSTVDVGLNLRILQSNTSIPVIIADEDDNIIDYRNLNIPEEKSDRFLEKKLDEYKKNSNTIEIPIDNETRQYLYYDDSILLKRLSYYPMIQMGVMILFIIIAYLALMSTKKAEQNKVWVGLSKETAHQLGTPISSLMAWMDLLELNGVNKELLSDMNKDVKRLSVIAERFSKIGSKPEMKLESVNDVLTNATEYMRRRVSEKVKITTHTPDEPIYSMMCVPLIEWVIENLCKNAIDAMSGEGKIDITLFRDEKWCYIEIKDSGKGILKKYFKTIFHPGFTTKKRGWGLGLTLVKRIIEEYHDGKIFVKDSEIGKGTTFRIELRLA
ncbi:sensor histidine kinase [Coprobacter tertius]|uniref:histidine kinase n=1 Tax=Coprobacter tertius TaxID=2944915 RepID=A0ABT1MLF9_9BACT|nr:HAMP domain-containing sensor histidine kinase [Coprobacter tertius]MCP9612548.1 HAMP domain-containing histidine kinase [Coprobacter tertius]